jgi:predicted transcriptional regulator
MAKRVSLKGKHNFSKVLTLLGLLWYSPALPVVVKALSPDMPTLAAVKVALGRYVRYGYLARSGGRYSITDKGKRFLYAASQLADWYGELELLLTNKERQLGAIRKNKVSSNS